MSHPCCMGKCQFCSWYAEQKVHVHAQTFGHSQKEKWWLHWGLQRSTWYKITAGSGGLQEFQGTPTLSQYSMISSLQCQRQFCACTTDAHMQIFLILKWTGKSVYHIITFIIISAQKFCSALALLPQLQQFYSKKNIPYVIILQSYTCWGLLSCQTCLGMIFLENCPKNGFGIQVDGKVRISTLPNLHLGDVVA